MQAYRVCPAPRAALDGEGARLYGGRWNPPGRPAVYTSATRALAALEYLVHVDPDDVPADLIMLTIEIPDDVPRDTVDPAALAAGWERIPEHPSCQQHGDTWLAGSRTAVLEVPSAPIPEERNILLNPRHPDAARIVAIARRPFAFGPRLLA
jgi:RES domain-containing protein